MPIEIGKSGTVVCTGDGITLYQMIAQRGALRLELVGLRHSSGRSVYAHIKKTYRLSGNKQKVYEAFCKIVDDYSKTVKRVSNE